MLVHPTVDKLIIRALPAGADTGKRFLRGQTALSHGVSPDAKWLFVDAPDGSGWASAQYLESLPTPAAPTCVPTAKRLLYSLMGEAPEFSEALEKLRAKAELEGIAFDTADFGGVRSEADTTKIMKYRDDDYAVYVRNLRAKNPNARPTPKEQWRAIAPFGSSMHNYGFARDLKIVKHPPSFSEAECLRRLGALAPSCGLKWGGTFSKRVDPPHFQLDITLAEAKRRYENRK